MEILEVNNLFIREITNGFKILLFISKDQVGKGLRQAHGLHCWAHLDLGSSHPHDGLAITIKRFGLSTWTIINVRSESDHPHDVVLYLVTLIVQGQWLYTRHWIWSGRITPRGPTCIVHGPNKRYVDLTFRYLYS